MQESTIATHQTTEKTEQNEPTLGSPNGSAMPMHRSQRVATNDSPAVDKTDEAAPLPQWGPPEGATKAETALWWARQGFKVVPLKPGTAEVLIASGVHDATSDEQLVAEWWKTHPDCNIGIGCGKNAGIVALQAGPWSDEDWQKRLDLLERTYGPFNTAKATTVSGGLVFLFRVPQRKDIESADNVLVGVDVLSRGKCVSIGIEN